MNIPELKNVNIYLTWNCNFRCIHCWVEADSEKKEFVNTDTLYKFIEEAQRLGLENVKLTGGEPFIHKKIKEIIQFLGEKGLNLTIETNASLLTVELIDLIKKYKVFLGISFNGYDKTSNDSFTKHNGAFETVLKAIKLCVEKNIEFEVITCVGHHNIERIEKYLSFIDSLNVPRIKINTIINFGRADDNNESELSFTEEELLLFVNDYKKFRKKYKTKIIMMIPLCLENISAITKNDVCTCGGEHLISFLPNGDLALCGYAGIDPDIIIDKYKVNELKQIWETNPKLLNMREGFFNINGICIDCVHKKDCRSLCKAVVYKKYKKWNNPFPLCNYLIENDKFPQSRIVSKTL